MLLIVCTSNPECVVAETESPSGDFRVLYLRSLLKRSAQQSHNNTIHGKEGRRECKTIIVQK